MIEKKNHRLLIANRGEIASRIIRGAKDEGWHTIAIYSDADASAPHVLLADEAHPVGPAPAHQSYLNMDRILEVARESEATHVHPGYGFFSENPDFVQKIADAGLKLIGPSAAAIRAMGDKVAARNAAEAAKVPLVPGSPPLPADPEVAVEYAKKIGYPVLIKAAFGGGGKGMRLCKDVTELRSALALTRGEAGRSFGNDTIFIERALLKARHVEIQILCDEHGNGVYLGERECSIQRRHQKLIEETPCVVLDPATRKQMGEAAVRLALDIGYHNAATVEYLLDETGQPYFLEMNTRLQVEHPITEMVTGIDLVRAQLRIADGEPLPWKQDDIHPQGAAIECRIIAEDASAGFVPQSGPVHYARLPQGPGVRNDVGFLPGREISVHYDSMIGKLITWGNDREEARTRMLRALDEYLVEGVRTNVDFQRWALAHPEFVAGNTYTRFIDDHFRPEMLERPDLEADAAIIAAVATFRHRMGSAGAVASGTTGQSNDPNAPRVSPWKRARTWSGR
ncbi:MAG: biotin carboxylase N-terminal domain-containing protein [Candidatus Eisenbacteria bacterium]